MGVTNAISSVIIVGAILAAGPQGFDTSKIFGLIGVVLASVNIFGGFLVTYRMLSMFKKTKKQRKRIMSSNMVAILYLISALLFIFALRGLSHPNLQEWVTFLVLLE